MKITTNELAAACNSYVVAVYKAMKEGIIKPSKRGYKGRYRTYEWPESAIAKLQHHLDTSERIRAGLYTTMQLANAAGCSEAKVRLVYKHKLIAPVMVDKHTFLWSPDAVDKLRPKAGSKDGAPLLHKVVVAEVKAHHRGFDLCQEPFTKTWIVRFKEEDGTLATDIECPEYATPGECRRHINMLYRDFPELVHRFKGPECKPLRHDVFEMGSKI